MILDKNRIFDGYGSLVGGMDAGRNPALIDKTQCAKANNFVFRGGYPKPRPGVRVTWLEFKNPHMFYNADGTFGGPGSGGFNSSSNFQLGIFQDCVSNAA